MIQPAPMPVSLRDRIAAALDALPWEEHFTPAELKKLAPHRAAVIQQLMELFGWLEKKRAVPLLIDSPLFDFALKIEHIVESFADQGLTTKAYLATALKQPSLFYQKPETLIANIEGVATHFADQGLTAQAYLAAALKQPSLFTQKPETLIANIEGVATHFADQGLTAQAYLAAALKQPSLFSQKPETLIANIEGVVTHFADQGLTTKAYLAAALKKPPLFYQKPETLIANIEGVATHFADQGLTAQAYLAAALKQPSLFTQKPETIKGHLNIILSLYERGFLALRGDPLTIDIHPALRWAIAQPAIICLASENWAVREVRQYVAPDCRRPPSDFYMHSRAKVEKEVATAYGYGDKAEINLETIKKTGLPKMHANADRGQAVTQEQANNFAMRALIHAGLITGKLR